MTRILKINLMHKHRPIAPLMPYAINKFNGRVC